PEPLSCAQPGRSALQPDTPAPDGASLRAPTRGQDSRYGESPMGAKMLKVSLSELTIGRAACQKCKGVMELPLGEFIRHGFAACPICGNTFDPSKTGTDAIAAFAQAAVQLQQRDKFVRFEFLVPEE